MKETSKDSDTRSVVPMQQDEVSWGEINTHTHLVFVPNILSSIAEHRLTAIYIDGSWMNRPTFFHELEASEVNVRFTADHEAEPGGLRVTFRGEEIYFASPDYEDPKRKSNYVRHFVSKNDIQIYQRRWSRTTKSRNEPFYTVWLGFVIH